jgi:hypothetical protein
MKQAVQINIQRHVKFHFVVSEQLTSHSSSRLCELSSIFFQIGLLHITLQSECQEPCIEYESRVKETLDTFVRFQLHD